MKKLLSFMLVLAMVLSSVAPAMATVADDSVANLNEMGIVQGYADGTFGLENNITRAEFAAIVVRMLGLEDLAKNSVYTSQFPDVSDNWYVGYVNVAAGKGIIKGNEDGTFAPQANVTYAQAATMIVRYLGEEVEGNVWPANYLAKATELGVLKNAPSSASVMDATTRGTVFTMANNALKTGESNKPVVSKVKALVIENSRVETLANDEIVVRVMDDYTRADMEINNNNNDNTNFNGLKAGAEFSYTVKKNEDVEYLLGKVVNLGFTGSNVTSVEVSDEYDYVAGFIEEVDKDSFEVDEKKYTVEKSDRFGDVTERPDRRFYQAYINGEDESYSTFDDNEEYDFARVTVKNGKVLFIDAYQFEDISPIEEMENGKMSIYEDDRQARTKKYDIEDDYEVEDLIEVRIEDGKTDLYRLDIKDIDADQIAHFTDENDEILVRTDAKLEGEYDKVRTKEVDGKDDTVIYFSDYKKSINFDDVEVNGKEYDNRQAIYSKDGTDYDVLGSKFKKNLEDFEDRDVIVLVDMFDDVQLIKSDFQDPRFFAVVDNRMSSKIRLVGEDNESKKYDIDVDTDVYNFVFDKYEADEYKIDEIYDPSKKIELTDIQEDNIDELLTRKSIVYVEVEDDDVISSLVVIDIDDDNYFETNIFDENHIKKDRSNDWEIDNDTQVYFLDDTDDIDDVKVYESADKFLKEYDVDDDGDVDQVKAIVIPSEDDDNLADIIIVKVAPEDDDLKEDKIVKIVEIEDGRSTLSLVFEDGKEKEETYEVKDDSKAYYKLAHENEDGIKDEDFLREGDIIEITYRESDKEITEIRNLITENSKNEDDTNYRIFRLLDVNDSDALVLGYDKDGEIAADYTDEEKYYAEIEDSKDLEEQTLRVNNDAEIFGDDQPTFIMVSLDDDNRIEATIEVDEDDVLDGDFKIKTFATSEVGEEQVEPPVVGDETAEVTVELGAIPSFKKITVEEATVGTQFKVVGFSNVKDFGEAITAMTTEDELEVELLDADGEKVGSFMIDVDEAVSDKEVDVEEVE